MATVIEKLTTGTPEADRERIKHSLELVCTYAHVVNQLEYFRTTAKKMIEETPESLQKQYFGEAPKKGLSEVDGLSAGLSGPKVPK
jgi:hypothetical protein